MYLPFFIARRYLFAKKSHNVINIISAISAIGMGIGTAALIIILSIYNGFNDLVSSSLGNVEPDILVTPVKGKVFIPDNEAFDWAYGQTSILNICSVLQDNAYVSYSGHNGVAQVKGVDRVYEEESPLAEHLIDGKFALHKGQVSLALVGAGLAYKMDISPRFVAGIELYFPARDRKFSLTNPAASVDMVKVYPAGIFALNTDIDDKLIIVPIEKMRELLGYTEEVSAIEIRMVPGASQKELTRIIRELSGRLGPDYRVSNRFRQNESLYKMMRYEKAAVYLILIFVIIIIAFNIFGSLSMLIIEKKEDIATLHSLGADRKLVRRIFLLEGWMISFIGMLGGLVTGLCFALLQQKLGFIKMPGSFAAGAYPVIVEWADILTAAVCISIVGYLIALMPVAKMSPERL